MRKLILYIASSINGKIARKDGAVDWLESIPNPDQSDYGYNEFYNSIDTTIMGYNTYAQIIGWDIDFPYRGKKNFVFTRKQQLPQSNDAEFVTKNHTHFIQALKQQPGKDIWLIGGGQLNTALFNVGLIDEIQLFVMPIVLPKGIDLFEALPKEALLHLEETKVHTSGAVSVRYSVSGVYGVDMTSSR